MNDFFDLLNGFRINGAFPIDSRFVVADEAARLAIPVNAVYKGLFTFQADNNLLYIYDGDDQTNVDSAWTSFTVNNIDVDNITSVIAPNGNTVVTLPFENGQTSQFVVQRGEVGPESQYSIEVIGEFAEDIIVAAPEGGSYNVDTRELDTTTLTAGWFDPFTQQVPALQDGNAYYRARFLIVPARLAGVTSLVPIWSSPVQLSGDQGPQGLTGAPGAPGNDGDSFVGVVQSTVPSRGGFTEVQPRKQDHNGVITDAGNPIRLAAGFTGASVSDVDIVTQGGTGQPTTIQFEITSDQGATSTLPTLVTIPPGASGSGTGDVLVSGNISLGQYAKWSGPTSISGQTGVPAVDVTGLSLKDNTTFATIFDDLDTRDVRVQNGRIRLTEADGTQTSSTGFAILSTVMENEATPVQSSALHTEFASKQDNITGDSESITIPQHGSTPSIVFVKANTNLSNVDSTLTDQEKADFRAKIGAGTGSSGSDVDDLAITGSTLQVTENGTPTGTGIRVEASVMDEDGRLVSSKAVFDGLADKVDLSPTGSQTITTASGSVLTIQGSVDFDDNDGDKIIDISGTSGDIHIEDDGNVKTLYDKSAGQWYADPTNTSGNLSTSDDNKLMRAGGLAIGAISVGHADFSGNNEEAIIELGYENTVISELPLNVETSDADAAETFLKRNTHGEIIFSLSNVIQSGDLRPATSAAVNTAISSSGSFNPGGPNTDGFVLTNDGTGAYNWEVSTGGDGLQVISAFSEITSPTNGQDVYLDTTDGTNRPGIYQYNSTDSEWVIVIGGAGVPFGNTLPITNTGTVGELFRLLQSDGEYSLGFYVRVSNLGTIADWRQLGEETGNGTLPTTNRYDGRVFYLESHEGIDETGWYVWRDAATGIPADWYKAGTQWEAERIYPEVGGSAPATDHVEPFLLNSGLWNHANQLYIYVGASVSINSATDLFNNSPEEAPDDWETWEDFVARATTGGGTALTERFQPNGATAFTIGTLHTGAAGTAPANSLYFRTASTDNTKLTITDFSQLEAGNQIVFDFPDGTPDNSPGGRALTALQNGGTLFISSGTASSEMQVSGIAGNPAVAGGNKRFTISSVTHSFGTVGTAASTSFILSTEAITDFYQDDKLVGPRFTEYHFSNSYNAGDFAWSAGELFQCTASYTAPHNQELPQNQPEHWKAVTHQIEIFDSLEALTDLNATGKPTATVTPGELSLVWQDPTASNNGLYLVTASDTTNYTAGTTVTKLVTFGGGGGTEVSVKGTGFNDINIVDDSTNTTSVRGITWAVTSAGVLSGSVSVAGLGTGGSDGRFQGAPVAAGIASSGVTVSAVGLIHNSLGEAVTVILPSANPTTPFAIGEHVHTTDADGAITYVISDTFVAQSGVVEIIINGDHRTAWQGATDIFIDRTATPVNTIFAVTNPGAGALQLSDSLINVIEQENETNKIALANEAKVDSLLDILTISTAWETQGTYLTTTWPGLITNHTAGQGNSLYTSPTLRVFPDGRYEFSIYASFPTDELPASFTDEFGTATQANKPIAGIAFSSSAYDNIPFPHVLQSEFIRSQPLGTGGTTAGYGGRHLVVFGGILTDAQNADRSFIQNASDTFAIYGEYSLYAFYPNNDVYDNFRVGDPAEIFAFTVGIYDLYQLHDMNTDADGDRIGLEYVMFAQGGYVSAWIASTPANSTTTTGLTIDTITGLTRTEYTSTPRFTDTWYEIADATITSGALVAEAGRTVWTTALTGVGAHASSFVI